MSRWGARRKPCSSEPIALTLRPARSARSSCEYPADTPLLSEKFRKWGLARHADDFAGPRTAPRPSGCLSQDYSELPVDGQLVPIDRDVPNFTVSVVEQDHSAGVIEVPSVTRRNFPAVRVNERARPRAGYALDGDGRTSVDNR